MFQVNAINFTNIVTFFCDNIATEYKFYVKLNRNDIGMFKNPKIAIQKQSALQIQQHIAVLDFLVIWVWKSSTGWKPHIGGGKITNGALGAQIDQTECVFCKSHLLISIPSWKIKNYHPKTLFRPQKRSIFLGFHELPKKRVAISNPHFRKFTNFRK